MTVSFAMLVSPPLPTNEEERLAALYQYQVLDTEPEAAFDGLTHLAAQICQTPIALISLVDRHRQWFKSRIGWDIPETSRDVAFCAYAILQPKLLLISDVHQDLRFASNPAVISEPGIRFYAGAPLLTPDGHAIGTLCVLDNVSRDLQVPQQQALGTLAQQVVAQLELRQSVAALQQAVLEREQTANALLRMSMALEHAVEGIAQVDAQGRYLMVNPAYAAMVGYEPDEMIGMPWQPTVYSEDLPAVVAAYEHMLVHGKAEAEVRGVRKNGSLFFKQLVLVKACDLQPGGMMHYCFMKDITARKQAEADLKLAHDVLEKQVAERTDALRQANALLKQEITRRNLNEIALQHQAERERLMGAIAQRIRQSLDLDDVLNTTVSEVRRFLTIDRVVLFRLEPDMSGSVTVESVGDNWPSMLGRRLFDHCFSQNYVERYQQGRIHAVEDIYAAGLSDCYVQMLASYQIKANLVVPILQNETLWGLLVAQQCSTTRHWQPYEIDLLKQLSTQVAIAIQQANLYQQLAAANQELHRLATLDGLTQVSNRRGFDAHLASAWQRALQQQTPLTLILCDIDFFKAYNDTYGHQAGDNCLCQVAQAFQQVIYRPADLVARYGGEEFAVILSNTDLEEAIGIAGMLQRAVQTLKMAHASSLASPYVTLSLGIASLVPQPTANASLLISEADKALYGAKAAGRNCAKIAKDLAQSA